jgi:hypothetical protein
MYAGLIGLSRTDEQRQRARDRGLERHREDRARLRSEGKLSRLRWVGVKGNRTGWFLTPGSVLEGE